MERAMFGGMSYDALDDEIVLAECAFEQEKAEVMRHDFRTPLCDRRAYLKAVENRLAEMHERRRCLMPAVMRPAPEVD